LLNFKNAYSPPLGDIKGLSQELWELLPSMYDDVVNNDHSLSDDCDGNLYEVLSESNAAGVE
jgi:hypothetical protein